MGDPEGQPYIRRYNLEDRSDTVRVFRETADISVRTEPISTIGAHIWCLPYLTLSPETCFVLDDGHGHVVGYCIGTPDTVDFAQRWKAEYLPTLEHDLRDLPMPEDVSAEEKERLRSRRDELCQGVYDDPYGLVYGSFAKQLKDYPGHLHIDILPSHQRLGFGKKLVNRLLASLKHEGCKGMYLGMVAGNSGAARFYEREGFYRVPHVLDGGASGERGRTAEASGGGGTVYYVKDL